MNIGEIHRAYPYFPTLCRCVLLCNFTPGVDLCYYYHNGDTELSHHHKAPSLPSSWLHPPLPQPSATTDLLSISTTEFFQKCYINEIMQHVTF